VSTGTKPTHPELFKVDFAEGSFASCLKAVKASPRASEATMLKKPEQPFKSGETICAIHGSVPGPKQYSTVQVSPAEHIELQSDLLYCNHSCDPNVAFVVDGPQEDWHVEAVRDLEVGDVRSRSNSFFTIHWRSRSSPSRISPPSGTWTSPSTACAGPRSVWGE
jgi:hypothetical protein